MTNICNKIIASNEQHAKYLSKFVEAQAEYYELSNKRLNELLNDRTDGSDGKGSSTGFATFAALSENLTED